MERPLRTEPQRALRRTRDVRDPHCPCRPPEKVRSATTDTRSAQELPSWRNLSGIRTRTNRRALLSGLTLALTHARATHRHGKIDEDSKVEQPPQNGGLPVSVEIGWEAGIR